MNTPVLFDSKTNVGFKYGFFPLVLTGIIVVLLILTHIYWKELKLLNQKTVLILIATTIVLELILFHFLQITNRIKLLSKNNKLVVFIDHNQADKIEVEIEDINYWWSYDTRGGVEEADEWGGAIVDDGFLNVKNGSVRQSTLPLTRVLFLELHSSLKTPIVITEYLNNIKELPHGWTYRLRPLYSTSEIEGYKLDLLKNLIENNKA